MLSDDNGEHRKTMVISFFKKAFRAESDKPNTAAPDKESVSGAQVNGQADPQGFVEFVVKQLVDEPEQVTIETNDDEEQCLIEVRCAKPDMGKVIGKNGKTVDAIRALATSAGKRIDKRVRVEILD